MMELAEAWVAATSPLTTSVAARGREVVRVVHLKAVDQAALEAQAGGIVADDQRVTSIVKMTTAPNPTHWHDELTQFIDPKLNESGLFKTVEWALPLDGTDMALTLESL